MLGMSAGSATMKSLSQESGLPVFHCYMFTAPVYLPYFAVLLLLIDCVRCGVRS